MRDGKARLCLKSDYLEFRGEEVQEGEFVMRRAFKRCVELIER